jgi:hypothetical protein
VKDRQGRSLEPEMGGDNFLRPRLIPMSSARHLFPVSVVFPKAV